MALHWHKAQVTGVGAFPADMLRYDGCYPARTDDAVAMGLTYAEGRQGRSVTLIQVTDGKHARWTPARWESFGWTLIEVS